MKIIKNIPEGIYQRVLANVQKPDPDILRVTELINPPLIKRLTLEHWDELNPLASEFLWSLLGSAVHAELAKAGGNTLIEHRVTKEVFGITLSGAIDRYEIDIKTIADYKCTSVWAILLGLKSEWESQLNLYKFLLESEGHEVNQLKIHAILRDWQVGKSMQKGYPPAPFTTLDVPMWSKSTVNRYINERIFIHNAKPLPCTMKERWQDSPCFAIMQKGRKKAVKASYKDENGEKQFITNKVMAESFMAMINKPNLYVEERPSIAKRCKWYCLVRNVCPYNEENK